MKKIVGGSQCGVTGSDGREARHNCGMSVTCASDSKARTVTCGEGEVGYPMGYAYKPCEVNTIKGK